jgi:uncharacterized protein YjdB
MDGVPRTTVLSAQPPLLWPAWNISWRSSNSNIVQVETFDSLGISNARLTAKNAGVVTITVQITYTTDLSHSSLPTRTQTFYRHILVPKPEVKLTPEIPDNQQDTLDLDENLTLTVLSRYNGEDFLLNNIEWKSSLSSVVSVSGNGYNGKLTAKSPGSATITFSAKGGLDYLGGFGPYIFTRPVVVSPVQTIRILPALPEGHTADTLFHNAETTLSVASIWNGGEYPFRSMTWTSSDPQIASVSNNTGRSTTLTAHQSGSVTVTFHAEDDLGFGPFTLTRSIFVPDSIIITLSPALPSEQADTLQLNQTLTLSALAKYNGQPYPLNEFSWTSSKPDLVDVGSDGLITAREPGDAIITFQATTPYGELSVTRKVVVPFTPRILPFVPAGKEPVILDMGKSMTLTAAATYNKESYTLVNPIWESSIPNVVSVNNGILFAHQPGTVTITFHTDRDELGFGPFTLTRTVTVPAPPTVEILPSIVVIPGGQSYTLIKLAQTLQLSVNASYNDAPYTLTNPVWTSSASNIVSVKDGLLTAHLLTNEDPVMITFHSDKDTLGFGPFTFTRLILVSDTSQKPVTPEVPEEPETPEKPETPEEPVPAPSVFAIRISPALSEGQSATILSPNQTVELSVSATCDGEPYLLTDHSWASSNASIVAVNEEGIVVANRSGVATISCYAYGEQGLAGVVTRSFMVEGTGSSNPPDGIEAIPFRDGEDTATYHTLTGLFVGNDAPLLPGIYIRRTAAGVTKVIVR